MAAITLDKLVKRFGAQTVLQQLSLHVPDGAFYTLLGPSGCGKTTLLRYIVGLEAPDSGEILIGDEVVFSKDKNISVPTEKRGLGMVESNLTRRVDYAMFMVAALENDALVHEAPAIVGCRTPSALAYT